MRNIFAKEVTRLATLDERVVLLSGDIGNRLFDDFRESFPDRFYNCGVAEQNMIGVAAGLASAGLVPFVYTIAPFLVFRPFEQIKIDICYPDLPVVIAAVGAGLAYSELGPTHQSCEDVAVLRALPNLNIVCPGDSWELASAMRSLLSERHPTYLRLGKKGEARVHDDFPRDFEIGKALRVVKGTGACLISTGTMLPIAMEVSRALRSDGISTEVVSMHTVKPLDSAYLHEAASRFPLIVTLEEHSVIGGLGGAVAEWAVDRGMSGVRILRVGTPDRFLTASMHQDSARAWAGICAKEVTSKVREAVSNVYSRRSTSWESG